MKTLSYFYLLLFLGLLVLPASSLAGNFRADLQESYSTYLDTPLHYKVFALKHQDDRWDGWYSWGYDDLDLAVSDAIAKCSSGVHVLGKCHVYAIGNDVVAGLGPEKLAEKMADYRVEGMRLRRYPAPIGTKKISESFNGDGRFLGAAWVGSKGNRLFLYDTDERIWKHSAPIHTGFTPKFNRNLALDSNGSYFAFTEYLQEAGEKGRSFIHLRDWQKKNKWDVELTKGSFWNDACGLAFSPDRSRLAVCMDGGVDTRVQWFDTSSSKEVLRVTSKGLNGRFDQTIQFSPDGRFLLVRGARYQFDWVLKKKGKEADLAWVFDGKIGTLIHTFEFLVGPGRKGPADIRFAATNKLLVSEDTLISIYDIKSGVLEKQIPYTFSHNGRAALSPYGILAIIDGSFFKRYRLAANDLLELDSRKLNSPATDLFYDGSLNRWLLAGAAIEEIQVLSDNDLAMLDLYHEASQLFSKADYASGIEKLREAIDLGPYLPLGKDETEFYFKYPAIPLASFGQLLSYHAKMIIEHSTMISRIGLELEEDSKSGLTLTTVAKVDFQGPAYIAGLQKGDRLLAVDGQPIMLGGQINDYVAGLPTGSSVMLRVQRGEDVLTRTLITEKGFQEPGHAAHLLLDLFDYGQLAIQAGHPGLARLAAVRLRTVAARFPSSFPVELVAKVAVSLDALILAHEGDVAGGYELLLDQASPHPFKFRLRNTRVWWPFYAERRKMASILGVPVANLPVSPSRNKRHQRQAFPDLDGNLIPAVVVPALQLQF